MIGLRRGGEEEIWIKIIATERMFHTGNILVSNTDLLLGFEWSKKRDQETTSKIQVVGIIWIHTFSIRGFSGSTQVWYTYMLLAVLHESLTRVLHCKGVFLPEYEWVTNGKKEWHTWFTKDMHESRMTCVRIRWSTVLCCTTCSHAYNAIEWCSRL